MIVFPPVLCFWKLIHKMNLLLLALADSQSLRDSAQDRHWCVPLLALFAFENSAHSSTGVCEVTLGRTLASLHTHSL